MAIGETVRVGLFAFRRVQAALVALVPKLALVEVICLEKVGGMGGRQSSLSDIVTLDQSNSVEPDLVHGLARRCAAFAEHLCPQTVYLLGVANSFRQDCQGLSLDCCPKTVEDEACRFFPGNVRLGTALAEAF